MNQEGHPNRVSFHFNLRTMKSKNNLTITGILVTEVIVPSEHRYGHFTLAHNFGGRVPTLYLPCRIPGSILDGILSSGLKKGDAITLKAYIRPHGGSVEAVVKKLSIDR